MGREFDVANRTEWRAALNLLFNGAAPSSATWTERNAIVKALSTIGQHDLNHAFLPDGGGLDLDGAKLSVEEGCIELDISSFTCIVSPVELSFESFGADHLEWAYFRLETGPLLAFDSGKPLTAKGERATELRPGVYVDYSAWEQGYHGHDDNDNEIPLPKGARPIERLANGVFAIFAKSSFYNKITSTYDGRHAKMSREDFRAYVAEGVEAARRMGLP